MDCGLLGSPVHGIFQARTLEWAAVPFTRDLPEPGAEPASPALQADGRRSQRGSPGTSAWLPLPVDGPPARHTRLPALAPGPAASSLAASSLSLAFLSRCLQSSEHSMQLHRSVSLPTPLLMREARSFPLSRDRSSSFGTRQVTSPHCLPGLRFSGMAGHPLVSAAVTCTSSQAAQVSHQ